MIEIVKQGRLLKYIDVYFTESADYHVKQKCDVCTYQNIYNLHDKKNEHSVGYTLISDLTLSESELWSAIHKTTRYEIRRAERYSIEYAEYNSQQIANGEGFDFTHFSSMYEKMFQEKGLPRILDKKEFYDIILARGGIITTTLINSTPIIYHFYICDDKHAKLTISCSELWESENVPDRNMIGYANKALHWHDFLFLKARGIESYDWGGVTWNEENQGILSGINRFKQSFGGKPVYYYSETVLMSLKAKALKQVSKIKDRVKTLKES